jgi:hypothetical protein
MIKVLTAHTEELDDVEVAVSEILEQLDIEHQMLGNSVGIMHFYPEFLETGIAGAISDVLPFDVVGGTTSNSAVPRSVGELTLSLTVLTSDDISFASGVSASIDADIREPVEDLYVRVTAALPQKPSLLYAVAPILQHVSGDAVVESFDEFSGGVSLFGSLAFTHAADFSGVHTFFNGKQYPDALVCVAMSGNVNPTFLVTSLPEERVIRQKSIITEAENNAIYKVNGIPVLEYLESIGLAEQGKIDGISSIPLILTLKDGSQVVRSPYMMNESGHLISYGATPVDSRIDFATGDRAYVIQSAGELMIRAHEASRARGMLIFSCAARRWTLGIESGAEMKEVATRLNRSFQYQFAYAGGEICPVKRADGSYVNRFHNFSLIACIL